MHLFDSRFNPGRPTRRNAFTLIELILVIGIMAILFAMLIPIAGDTFGSRKLGTAGDKLLNELNLARQRAIADSQPVDVRFYRIASPTGDATNFVHAVAFVRERDDASGNYDLVDEVYYLDPAVAIATDTGLSTLANTGDTNLLSGTDTTTDIVPDHSSAPWSGFTFFTDGSTSLPATASGADTWHVTLIEIPQNNNATAAAPPDNFVTIVLDPFTGRMNRRQP